MSSNDATVTIDRDYFDTLLRRAQINADSYKANEQSSSVVISRAEYDTLTLMSKQYGNLRRNLLRGGVGQETVDLLSQDDEAIQAGHAQATPSNLAEPSEDGGARLDTPTPQAPRDRAYGQHTVVSHDSSHGRYYDQSGWVDDDVDEGEGDDGENAASETGYPTNGAPGATSAKAQGQRTQYERQCARTIQLLNLAEGTTHADITHAVRGGMLLDVFLRSNEKSAAVSFLNPTDAKKFYDHVRRHDLYIRNKRVEIKWSDRQFVLPGHVANRVAMGASRNLVLQGYDNRHTEEVIREDLDHIHNLVVIRVQFLGGNCYISLNSIHNAIYARQCMMSRLRYKGKKIHYDVDECSQPYPRPAPKTRKEAAPAKKRPVAVHNRFHLLNLDDAEEEEIAPTFQSKNTVGITA